MKPNKLRLLVTFTVLLGVAVAMGQEKSGFPEKLGKVHFPTSCSPTAQAQFERAVALLHSFWYEEAVTAFTAVTQADLSCAMGYWGVAMSMWYPLWSPPSPATLKQGWAIVEKAKAAGAKTQREQDYIRAIETFYKDSDKLDHRTRALAYSHSRRSVEGTRTFFLPTLAAGRSPRLIIS